MIATVQLIIDWHALEVIEFELPEKDIYTPWQDVVMMREEITKTIIADTISDHAAALTGGRMCTIAITFPSSMNRKLTPRAYQKSKELI